MLLGCSWSFHETDFYHIYNFIAKYDREWIEKLSNGTWLTGPLSDWRVFPRISNYDVERAIEWVGTLLRV
jgi:hypothetical protein